MAVPGGLGRGASASTGVDGTRGDGGGIAVRSAALALAGLARGVPSAVARRYKQNRLPAAVCGAPKLAPSPEP
jgi:hypothetical protein